LVFADLAKRSQLNPSSIRQKYYQMDHRSQRMAIGNCQGGGVPWRLGELLDFKEFFF